MAHSLPVFLILGIALASVQAAEDDFQLLTIEGHLIGLVEPFDGVVDNKHEAAQFVSTYHQLLTLDSQAQVDFLHEQILALLPNFEVAYTAADSAEIDHLMSEIDVRLAVIREVHARSYAQDVIDLLNEAYRLILPTFGDAR